MSFNYGYLESMLPLFGNIANSPALANHPNFINQLAAALTTAVSSPGNATPNTNAVGHNANIAPPINNFAKRDRMPDTQPAPAYSLHSMQKIQPNRGTVPMDLESDDAKHVANTATVTSLTPNSKNSTLKTIKPAIEKLPHAMNDPNMFLNGYLPTPAAAGFNTSPYMFFPNSATSGTSSSTVSPANQASGQMMVDPTAMLAAMQQMQQSYTAGFGNMVPSAESSAMEGPGQANANEETNSSEVVKEVIKTRNCVLFPPNPNAPPPTIRERPLGCRTVFVGGLPENITEELIREIFDSCGEIATLRMSRKNFCHIRFRQEASIDRAIYLSGYRVRINSLSESANFGRLHVDYAQARDDQYDYECKQRQLQREQRHRERMSLDRTRSQSPPPIPHYSDPEATLVAESLRNSDTFIKAVHTISVWLERGDCTKRNANVFYSMIQSTHAHVRRLHTDKQQMEEDMRKARESYRKQMLTMSTQFTQIEKVFSAASHKKVWDHFTKAQRKNIDQWKKLASELRCVQIEDDEMEMSDDDRGYHCGNAKRMRYDSDNLKEENDSLRCQLEAMRSEMSLVRTDIKYDTDFREKQIKVLQETIRNMQTQLLQTKVREQKDLKTIEQLERKNKEASVKLLLLKTKVKEATSKIKGKVYASSLNSETNEIIIDEGDSSDEVEEVRATQQSVSNAKDPTQSKNIAQVIDIDGDKNDDDVRIIEETEKVNADANKTKPQVADKTVKQTMLALEQRTSLNENALKTKSLCENDLNSKMKVKQTNGLVGVSCEKDCEPKDLSFQEAQIIALASTYLIVQPFGVCVDTICAYLRQSMDTLELQKSTVVAILTQYKNLFLTETEGTNDDTRVKWKFCGFTTSETTSATTAKADMEKICSSKKI